LDEYGASRGTGAFDDCAAPSGTGERIDAMRIVEGTQYDGDTIQYGRRTFTPRLSTRRDIVRRVRAAAVARRMQDTETVQDMSAADMVREDITEGRIPRATETVVETSRFDHTIDAEGKGHWRTARLTASGAMVQLEALHSAHRAERRTTVALMSAETSGDGRGTIQSASRIADSVNGTETRYGARWQGSRRRDIRTQNEDGEWVAVDWHAYRVLPNGERERIVSTATAKRRKRSAADEAARTKATERAERNAESLMRQAEQRAELGAALALNGAYDG